MNVRNLIGILILIFFVSMIFQSCSEKKDFYSYSYCQDLARIPLIEPYELRSYNGGVKWAYDVEDAVFSKKHISSQLMGVEKVGINGQIIALYLSEEYIPDINKTKTPIWYVIDTKLKRDTAFLTESDFINSLKTLGLHNIKFHDVHKVFTDFDQDLVLPNDWKR